MQKTGVKYSGNCRWMDILFHVHEVELPPLAADVKAYWKFNNAGLQDVTSPTPTTISYTTGILNNAIDFTAAQQKYVIVPSSSDLNPGTDSASLLLAGRN